MRRRGSRRRRGRGGGRAGRGRGVEREALAGGVAGLGRELGLDRAGLDVAAELLELLRLRAVGVLQDLPAERVGPRAVLLGREVLGVRFDQRDLFGRERRLLGDRQLLGRKDALTRARNAVDRLLAVNAR